MGTDALTETVFLEQLADVQFCDNTVEDAVRERRGAQAIIHVMWGHIRAGRSVCRMLMTENGRLRAALAEARRYIRTGEQSLPSSYIDDVLGDAD